jgi:hypothetical protein
VIGREGNSWLRADDAQQNTETSTNPQIVLAVLLGLSISTVLLSLGVVRHENGYGALII